MVLQGGNKEEMLEQDKLDFMQTFCQIDLLPRRLSVRMKIMMTEPMKSHLKV